MGGVDRGFGTWIFPRPIAPLRSMGERLRRNLAPPLFSYVGSPFPPAAAVSRHLLSFLASCPDGGCFAVANYMEAHSPFRPALPHAGRFTGDALLRKPKRVRASMRPEEVELASLRHDERILELDVTATLAAIGSGRSLGAGRDLREPSAPDRPVAMQYYGRADEVEERGLLAALARPQPSPGR